MKDKRMQKLELFHFKIIRNALADVKITYQ